MGKIEPVITALNIFSPFFYYDHVYNTKYFDQKQSCRVKIAFIAGHKDVMTKNYYRYIFNLVFSSFEAHCINREFKTVNYTFSAI